jgi:radical SAM superfamily enzyme YgiQ (UPF0313 family)
MAVRCLLIAPRFSPHGYWNYRETCELIGARYPAAPLGLLTVAALLPRHWEVRLLDLNVRDLDLGLIDWADVVMSGGMVTQQASLLSLIELVHGRGKRLVIGGQDATSQPELYAAADHLVLDEGEMTIPPFVEDFESGRARRIYRSAEKPDLTESPVPRFDLLELDRYLHVGVQFSRGCPFNCEFCDIIELYGRRPRTKAPRQVLAELDALHRLGYRGHVDFVDDNFIGNKKLVLELLAELLAWSRERGFPFYFSTEATINLADDPRLMAAMEAVDFRYVFLGIETPDPGLLAAAQKKQNTRAPIVESVRRLQAHGFVVTAGFILGFDGERAGAADAIAGCVEAAGIPMAMVGLLTALPTTQLTRRLAREGRLPDGYSIVPPDHADQATAGLNFTTLRPRAAILAEYAGALARLYAPDRYGRRVRTLARRLRRTPKQRGPTRPVGRLLRGLAVLTWRLGFARATAASFWRTVLTVLLTRPANFEVAMQMLALYLHFRAQTRFVLSRLRPATAGEPVTSEPAAAAF